MSCRKGMATLTALVLVLSAGPSLAETPGDAGHSGNGSPGAVVHGVRPAYARVGTEDRGIVTSVIATDGPIGEERLVYGTRDGRVHLRRLSDGEPVGAPGGLPLASGRTPFGSGGAAFADAATSSAFGQVFVAFQDVRGIAIAQIDGATGELVQRVLVGPGHVLGGSTLLSEPLNPGGDRALFFVGLSAQPPPPHHRFPGAGTAKLFKVTIARTEQREAKIGPVTDTGSIEANLDASPTLAYLAAYSTAVEPHVLVGTTDGRVLSFSMVHLAPGPRGPAGGEDHRVMTPAVPVTSSGHPPGRSGSGFTRAPHAFAASTDGTTTIAHRLTPPDVGARFTTADSPRLAGGAGPGLATNQLVAPGQPASGLVYVPTSANLYALDAHNLTVRAQLSPTDLPAGRGFSRSVPAVAGNVVLAVRDDGEQLVLDAQTLQPVDPSRFVQHPANHGSTASFGRPGITGSRAYLASDRGLFVYHLET